jgi:hypothetical protein
MRLDAGADSLTIAHGESGGRILGRTRNEGFGAAGAKEARKGRVDHPVRDQFVRAQRARRRFNVLDQQHALRSDPTGEPSSKTITCYLPGPWNVLRSAHHSRCRPNRHAAVKQHAANSCRRCYKLQLSSEIRERVAILVHGKQRHPVGGAIVEAHSGLGRTYRVGERTASWHHNHSPGASSDRIDPILQITRVGVASTELDYCEINRFAHSLGQLACCGWIEIMDLRHLGRPFPYDLNTYSA